MGEESLHDPAHREKRPASGNGQGSLGETIDHHTAVLGDTPPAKDVNLLDHATPTGTAAEQRATFGRYQVESVVGSGGFGVVYRGFDPELRREVAIKVPCTVDISAPADAETYLNEARLLASLNHPGIVPVYDCGRTDDGLCYVVSQFIRSGDLKSLLAGRRLAHAEVAELAAHVADALDHAHQHGLVHRDVKPGNILIDDRGRPLLADFGLALTDEAYGRAAGVSGTVAYMSPEQASGNGHLVDARSDIYSLGVVLYELLAGRRPYRQTELAELLQEILSGDIRPPRQLDHTIPEELERICLKALARQPADRYTTAFDMAEDLRRWQARHVVATSTASAAPGPVASGRSPAFKVVVGCGSLLTISITSAAALLLWIFGPNRIEQVAMAPLRQAPVVDEPPPSRSSVETSIPISAPPPGPIELESNVEAPSPARAAPLSLPLQVVSIDVNHYARTSATEAQPRGLLGKQSFAPRLGDQVTIEAKLSRPAYAYLVAFRPDGMVELCFPDEDSLPPPLTDRPRYPPAGKVDARYGLSDGAGLWVFAVVASEQALPAYRDFVSDHKPAWTPQGQSPGAVWWYDGQWVEALTGSGMPSVSRGKGEMALGTSAEVVRAATSLKTDSSTVTAAIGFSVEP